MRPVGGDALLAEESRIPMSAIRPLVASAFAAASLVLAARSAEAAPLNGLKSVGQEYSKSVSKGDFGAGFQVYAKAHATDYEQACTSTAPAYQCASMPAGLPRTLCTAIWTGINSNYCGKHGLGFSAAGKAEADITLFGKDFELFDIGASAVAEPSRAYTDYGVYILGAKIVGSTGAATLTKSVPLAERTLVTASSTFFLGPVPLTVKAQGVGSLGIDFSLAAGTSSITGTATPWAQIDGVFSAGLGVSGLSAGIEGDLVLVKLSTPASANIAWQGGKNFSYDASLDLVINSLDGSISLYGEAGPYKKSWEIISWTGLEYTKNLGHTSGSFSL
jgi:hypothetical protein